MTTSSYLRALACEYEHCRLYDIHDQAARAWRDMALEALRLMGLDPTTANQLVVARQLPVAVLNQLPPLPRR